MQSLASRQTNARDCLPTTARAQFWSAAFRRPSGPALVRVHGDALVDLSPIAPTSQRAVRSTGRLVARSARATCPRIGIARSRACQFALRRAQSRRSRGSSRRATCRRSRPAGVTFVASMLERVIEDRRAAMPRRPSRGAARSSPSIGDNLRSVRPGSAEAARAQGRADGAGLWSQYLEVGIGPDAEIFTKSQPMSAVGTGADIGIHPQSTGTIPSRRSCWP